ncbi:hypothetical protein BC829DRAFT_419177 [Chytridium lagenaria]|nr:hypothetical protein BC829DRAFT_419177 [Chytridium lagenaria]
MENGFGIRTHTTRTDFGMGLELKKQMEYTEMDGESRTMRQGLEFGTDLGLKETKERERNRFDADVRKNMGRPSDTNRGHYTISNRKNRERSMVDAGEMEQARLSGKVLERLAGMLIFASNSGNGWTGGRVTYTGKEKRGFEILISHAANGYELMKGRSYLNTARDGTFTLVAIWKMRMAGDMKVSVGDTGGVLSQTLVRNSLHCCHMLFSGAGFLREQDHRNQTKQRRPYTWLQKFGVWIADTTLATMARRTDALIIVRTNAQGSWLAARRNTLHIDSGIMRVLGRIQREKLGMKCSETLEMKCDREQKFEFFSSFNYDEPLRKY